MNMKGLSIYKMSFTTEVPNGEPNPLTEEEWDELTEDELNIVVWRKVQIDSSIRKALENNIVFEDGYMDSVEVEEGNIITLYIFIPDTHLQNLINFYEEVKEVDGLSVNPIKDVTDKVLFENKYLDQDDKENTFKTFLEKNLSKDDILDKITSIGFDNLSETDKKILNS